MINLFAFENYNIDTSQFSNILHDRIVEDFEKLFAKYVGAKYACAINSATNAIFLTFHDKTCTVKVPSMIPPVVVNAIVNNNKNLIEFIDDVTWIGHIYELHRFSDYKVYDSAHQVKKDQFKKYASPEDLMIFSFYPTKPIGGCDGGMIVSDDKDKIDWYRQAVHNGTEFNKDSWERKTLFPGWKSYMSSIQAFIALNNFLLYDHRAKDIKHIREYYNDQLGYSNTSDHLYIIKVRDNKDFLAYMKENNIQCGIHYEALHLNPVYDKYCINKRSLPLSETASKSNISIPFNYKLKLGELSHVCRTIKMYQRTRG